MKSLLNSFLKSLLIAVALVFALPGHAAESKKVTETAGELTLIHVDDLAKMMGDSKTATYVFDANNEKTRKANGVIAGAKTLASSHAYDASVLPSDKNANVVFYCANTACMASHEAAKRAKDLGYTHTMVMADGIQGWKKAGKPTTPFSAN
jgi:rhodanese-related sulfurtransferase